MKMLTKEISEVEKEITNCGLVGEYDDILILQEKLSTLKSAQAKFNEELESIRVNAYTSGYSSATNKEKAKFDKFIRSLKFGLDYEDEEDRVFLNRIDELSSNQEKDELPVTICPLKDGKDEISLCKSCYSMTKTIKGKCGKCGSKK